MNVYEKDIRWYKDWRFWLLVIAINISGNPGYNIIFPYHASIIGLFVGLLAYSIIWIKTFNKKIYIYILLWTCLFLLNAFYVKEFSLSSAIHIIMKMSIGLLVLSILDEKFCKYYSDIIYFFCVLSLLCFTYNQIYGVLPFINLGQGMDGGKGFRVTSIIYTQLYNLNSQGLRLRNCGPFWEPGAFQGFINLALMIELLGTHVRNRSWHIRVLVFVITIISTYSTGGYIVLALNCVYYIISNKSLALSNKMFLFSSFMILALIVFLNTDFLYAKIATDQGRLGTSSSDLFSNNIFYTLFGYGFAEESIAQSDIKSASSILNLFRYTGLIGFLLYFIPMIGIQIHLKRVFFALEVFLIMMNEPFITAGVFWWSMPLLFSYICKTDTNESLY